MEEKRKFVRLDTHQLQITWRKDDNVGDLNLSKNISAGGICLLLEDKKVEENDFLQLEFRLPSGESIFAKAKVVWVEEYEIIGPRLERRFEAGVEFLDLSDTNREKIKQFVFSSFSQSKNIRI